MPEPGMGNKSEESTVDADHPGADFERRQEGGEGARRRKRRLSPDLLALELEDGRLVGDVVAEYGAGIFAGSGLRLADGRLAESVIRPFGLGGLGTFGGFRFSGQGAQAQFALRERMRKERLLALSRLGFGNTVLTGPQGVTASAPATRKGLDSV